MGELTATQLYYTPRRLHKLVATWRKPKQGHSICEGFCKLFGTAECPGGAQLKQGHCNLFVIKANDVVEAQALIDADLKRSGVNIPRPKHMSQSD